MGEITAETAADNERLPLEKPLLEAIRIYTRRLGIFFAVISANIAVLALVIVVTKVMLAQLSTGHIVSLAISSLALIASGFWFYKERGFEPLISGLVSPSSSS